MGITNKLEEIRQDFELLHIEDITQRIAYVIGYLEGDSKVSKQDFINFLRELIY